LKSRPRGGIFFEFVGSALFEKIHHRRLQKTCPLLRTYLNRHDQSELCRSLIGVVVGTWTPNLRMKGGINAGSGEGKLRFQVSKVSELPNGWPETVRRIEGE
jgi:hypothetical protein